MGNGLSYGSITLIFVINRFFPFTKNKRKQKKEFERMWNWETMGELCGGPSPQIIPQCLAYLVIFSSNALIFPYLGPLLVMIVDTLIIGLEKWF